MNKKTCILCFVKYPEKGAVKQRLAADLNEDIVVGLYQNFVLDVLACLKTVDTSIRICFTPPNAEKKFQEWLGSTYHFIPQQGYDLGERMKNCFSSAFAEGFQHVLLIGSDSPDLPSDIIRKAFQILRRVDVVLGPSSDGGYYLIGFRHNTFLPCLFEEIPWSTPTVFKETEAKIKNTGSTVGLLPMWSDIDTVSDLKHLIQRSRDTAFKSSHTIFYIQQKKILEEEKK